MLSTAPATSASAAPARRTVAVVGNGDAGAVLQMGADAFSQLVSAAFADEGFDATIWLTPGKQVQEHVRKALAGDFDLVVLAGGDGTISRMLPELTGARATVAVLPLGTLNLLGRDLGLPEDIRAAISAISAMNVCAIDLATLNGVPFHSMSGVGFFSMMAREREKARRAFPFSKALGFLWAAARTLLLSKTLEVEVVISGVRHRVEADAVLVTNNRFDGTPWRRERLGDGLIEVHAFRARGLRGRLEAVVAVARGRWREIPALETFEATHAVLRRRDRSRTLVAVDGELRVVRGPLAYAVQPRALRVVAAPAAV